jgi:ATP-binding cassette subfamily B protein
MFKIKETLGLSDKGYEDFKRGVRACVMSNLTLLLPFIVIIQSVIALLDPLLSGKPLDAPRLWGLLTAGSIAAVVYFFAYRNEYRKTFTAAYSETEKIRLEVAEHMRRLPLSFFNDKDLSELTMNMMADCTSVEHVMSHIMPMLFGGAIIVALTSTMLAFYDWRMAVALFIPLPLSFGIIAASRKFQVKFGERHVQAKLGVSGQVQEYLEGIKVVKAFGLSGEKSRALESALRKMMWKPSNSRASQGFSSRRR